MKKYNIFQRSDHVYRADGIKKSRKRKILAGVLLVAFLGTAGFILSDKILEDRDISLTPPKDPVGEEPLATLENEDILEAFQRGSVRDSLSGERTLPRTRELNRQKPGTNHSMAASVYAYSTEKVRDWIWGGVPYEGKKIAFLTFDDGPVASSQAVLDVLKRRNVPATFFIPGYVLAEHRDKDVLHRYIEEGHAIGIHSYTHQYDRLYPGRQADPAMIVEEFDRTLDLMRESLGEEFDTRVFRFPGGSMSWRGIPEAQAALEEKGVFDMDWNSISGDGEPSSRRPEGAQAMAEHVMYTLNEHWMQDLAVVLMHDTRAITAEYLDLVIDEFLHAGYVFGILE